MTDQNKLFSCKTAHDWAVSSICIVVQSNPVKRAWPFQIESVDLGLGAPAYQCAGCGRRTVNPSQDLAALKLAGRISCCPDRKMVLVDFGDVKSAEAQSDRAGFSPHEAAKPSGIPDGNYGDNLTGALKSE
ncbi:MAG: hypothetical protein Q7R66_07820 [Undibacterium sp.]|uniref:hypothetical protein n=1 Tax=Undibacterium sp. TaxID=1914977 RepID=UPI002720F52B|nr:hypothetical protein [Undibacterium sp.]MDO8652081.1 hypothetical protein [Undibacterium sp.]